MPILGIIASSKPSTVSYNFSYANEMSENFVSTDGTTWVYRGQMLCETISGDGVYVNTLYYINSKFYAGAQTFWTSTDGTTWTIPVNNFSQYYSPINYNNSLYLVAGINTPVLAVSTDGLNYKVRNIPSAGYTFAGLAYGNSTYVALQNNGSSCITSTDNITWTSRATGISNMYVHKFKYLNNLFVGVGYDSASPTQVGRLATSTDGITWSSRTVSTSANSTIYDIDYGNGKYVAATYDLGAQYSTNAITWTTPTFAGSGAGDNFRYVIYAGGKFVIGGTTTYVNSSTDGVTWTRAASGYIDQYSCAYDGSTYYFGLYSDSTTNPGVCLVASTNLSTWTTRQFLNQKAVTIASNSTSKGYRYLNNIYLMSGSGGSNFLATSTDAVTWTTRNSTFTTQGVNDFAYGNGIYVAVGASAKLATSTDSVTWTSRTSGFGTSVIYAAGFGNGKFAVCGASAKLATSTNGVTWTLQTLNAGANAMFAVKYLNNQWITVGGAGVINTSTDAVTWTSRTNPLTASVRDVTYGNGKYVIVGSSGGIATSTDAVTWTSRTSPFTSSTINSVAYKNNLYALIAIGNDYTTTYGGFNGLSTSTDGITWSSPIVNENDQWYAGQTILDL